MTPVAILVLCLALTAALFVAVALARVAWALLVLLVTLACGAACIILPLLALGWLLH